MNKLLLPASRARLRRWMTPMLTAPRPRVGTTVELACGTTVLVSHIGSLWFYYDVVALLGMAQRCRLPLFKLRYDIDRQRWVEAQ
jgi:hypothetical protein